MCGICGIVNLGGNSAPDPHLVRTMMARLNHRGPDSSGYYRDATAALGHTRLSIIDLVGGAQPMSSEDGSLWISFNGEVFNYIELMRELSSLGHRFQTKSDTEAIIHAYEQWGVNAFERLNGQWALALWDARRKELLLSRDRLGIRPLYYTFSKGRLLFASEVKSILADQRVTRAPDPVGMEQIFTFWSPVAPRSAFRDIHQLRPGHFARIAAQDGHRQIKQVPYWTPDFTEDAPGAHRREEYASRLREHLLNAARLRFTRSDVPVGAYLSGGLDSSLTSAIVSAYTDAPLKTFSIGFEDSEFDETSYQAMMSERLGTDHQRVLISSEEIGRFLPDVVRHVERPILRTAPVPMYMLSQLVRQAGYKVVVTGEGADEVFAGYDIFREGKAREFIARGSDGGRRTEIIKELYPWMERSPTRVPAFAKAFFARNLDLDDPAISHRPRWDAAASMLGVFNPDFFSNGNKAPSIAAELIRTMPPDAPRWNSLARAQWLEMTTLLEGYILSAQGDRMLMAHSIEGRFPFLDPELVAFAGSVPARYKLMGLDEKHLLKAAFGNEIPAEILRRPKQPYRAPDAASLFGKGADWFDDLMQEQRIREAGLFRPEAIGKLIAKARRRGAQDLTHTDNMRIVGVTTAMLWHSQMIVGDGGGGQASDTQPPQPMTIVDRVGDKNEVQTTQY